MPTQNSRKVAKLSKAILKCAEFEAKLGSAFETANVNKAGQPDWEAVHHELLKFYKPSNLHERKLVEALSIGCWSSRRAFHWLRNATLLREEDLRDFQLWNAYLASSNQVFELSFEMLSQVRASRPPTSTKYRWSHSCNTLKPKYLM